MIHSRIPPAADRQDRIDDFVRVDRNRYIVEEAGTNRILAYGLNKWDLMEFVWTYGGRDYRIDPRMGAVVEDAGRDTGTTYQLADLFGLEWDVYFKNDDAQPWRKSRMTAYGARERDAVLNFLKQGFRLDAWADYFYVRDQGVTIPAW
jgi:hypothetical protein